MGRDKDERLAALRRVSLFRLCKDKELADIAKLCSETTFAPGTEITVEGDASADAYVVLEGRADVSVRGEKIAIAGDGDIIGEMSLLDGGVRSATVTAVTEVQALVLNPTQFADLLDRHGSVARLLMVELARRLRERVDAPAY